VDGRTPGEVQCAVVRATSYYKMPRQPEKWNEGRRVSHRRPSQRLMPMATEDSPTHQDLIKSGGEWISSGFWLDMEECAGIASIRRRGAGRGDSRRGNGWSFAGRSSCEGGTCHDAGNRLRSFLRRDRFAENGSCAGPSCSWQELPTHLEGTC